MADPDRTPQHHPVVVAHQAHRAGDIQLRIADAITAFAGSMPFVYVHAIGFAAWMLFVENDPWPKLTLVVSLEAIFLSTFVMIGQNRQASFQRAKADHDFIEQEQELKLNTELTRAIHALATDIHGQLVPEAATAERPTRHGAADPRVPSAGFEPAHTAPEADALSPELRGRVRAG
jgi:uncharacterized membrane protein